MAHPGNFGDSDGETDHVGRGASERVPLRRVIAMVLLALTARLVAGLITFPVRTALSVFETVGVLLMVVVGGIVLPVAIYWIVVARGADWRAWALLLGAVAVPAACFLAQIDSERLGHQRWGACADRIELWLLKRVGLLDGEPPGAADEVCAGTMPEGGTVCDDGSAIAGQPGDDVV